MGSRRINVIESEKTPAIFMANHKAAVMLKKNLFAIDKSRQTVVHRITVNQKVAYRKFKTKLHQTKLNHARIVGDRATLKELMDKKEFSFNTNLGESEEEKETLQKIWRSRTPAATNESPEPKASPYELRRRALTAAGAREKPKVENSAKRPATVHGNSASVQQSSSGNGSGVIVTLTGKPYMHKLSDVPKLEVEEVSGDEDLDSASDDDDDDNNHLSVRRAKTSFATSRKSASSRPGSSRGPNIFLEDDRPTLLDIHRDRIKSANYGSRVKLLCDKLDPYTEDKEKFIKDYYTLRVADGAKDLRKNFVPLRRRSSSNEKDIRRATGNPDVRSLTLKSVTYDMKNLLNLKTTLTPLPNEVTS